MSNSNTTFATKSDVELNLALRDTEQLQRDFKFDGRTRTVAYERVLDQLRAIRAEITRRTEAELPRDKANRVVLPTFDTQSEAIVALQWAVEKYVDAQRQLDYDRDMAETRTQLARRYDAQHRFAAIVPFLQSKGWSIEEMVATTRFDRQTFSPVILWGSAPGMLWTASTTTEGN